LRGFSPRTRKSYIAAVGDWPGIEEQVVVIDGGKFHPDQSLARVRLTRLREINQIRERRLDYQKTSS
jgi:hypothetical protein